MKPCIRNLLAFMIICFAGLTVCRLPADEIIFSNGLNGYNGTRDLFIQGTPKVNSEKNFSNAPNLIISGNISEGAGDRSMALIRFEDIFGGKANQIPEGAVIKSASLQLHKLYDKPKDEGQYSANGGKWSKFYAYPMLAPFDAKAACFSYRAFSKDLPAYWGNAYKLETGPVRGVDYEIESSGRVAITPMCPGKNNVWMSWDITAMVVEWQKSPASNHGIYVMAMAWWIGAVFDSAEALAPANRPRLVVSFTPSAKKKN